MLFVAMVLLGIGLFMVLCLKVALMIRTYRKQKKIHGMVKLIAFYEKWLSEEIEDHQFNTAVYHQMVDLIIYYRRISRQESERFELLFQNFRTYEADPKAKKHELIERYVKDKIIYFRNLLNTML